MRPLFNLFFLCLILGHREKENSVCPLGMRAYRNGAFLPPDVWTAGIIECGINYSSDALILPPYHSSIFVNVLQMFDWLLTT